MGEISKMKSLPTLIPIFGTKAILKKKQLVFDLYDNKTWYINPTMVIYADQYKGILYMSDGAQFKISGYSQGFDNVIKTINFQEEKKK